MPLDPITLSLFHAFDMPRFSGPLQHSKLIFRLSAYYVSQMYKFAEFPGLHPRMCQDPTMGPKAGSWKCHLSQACQDL